MDVSIIIVNYNTRDLTCQCIDSVIKKTEGVNYEIIVVDNASSDDSVATIEKKYPEVVLLPKAENMGFGRANNAGAEVATGRYFFMLNSDTILVENVIKSFFDFMESNCQYSACGCNLINADGVMVPAHGNFPSLLFEMTNYNHINKLFRSYFRNKIAISQTSLEGNIEDTDYISGADIFIRAEDFRKVGGFDKSIFMYFEETDLFTRMKKAGMKSCILPQFTIIHLVGGTKTSNFQRIAMYEKGRIYYYRKNYSRFYAFMVKIVKMIMMVFSKNDQKRKMIDLYAHL